MTCPDLCTAAKCAELEARIGALEQAIELLEAAFEAYTQQDIPQAHNYTPYVRVSGAVHNGYLIIDVEVDDGNDSTTVKLPSLEDPLVNVEAAIDNGTIIFDVTVGEENDFATVDLPKQSVNVEADIDGSTIIFDVTVGEENDFATVTLPEPSVNVEAAIDNGTIIFDVTVGDSNDFATVTLPEQSVNVEADINENTIIFDVTVGDSNDFATVDLPIEDPHVKSNLQLSGRYQNDVLTIDIADGESSDSLAIFIDRDVVNNFGGGSSVSCDNLSQDIQDCCAAILNGIGVLSQQLTNIENVVAIDISETINTDYECKSLPPNKESENSSTLSVEPIFKEVTYQGIGLIGIHENLKIINKNLDVIFETTCVKELTDVVSIVASDNYLNRATGKYLILHFVTLDNYPKRKNLKSSYWQVQIPAAKESYVWQDDFESLRFNRGNQFAQLIFNEFSTPVKGYFKSEETANTYFDAILGLTTATEKNRTFPKHKTPQTNVIERETRPYRAFIESINSRGEAVCHSKYVPPKKDNE